MYICILLKKITGWIDLQYKIIITKYLNIAIAFHQTRACARGCSKKWWLQKKSHSKRVEQVFYTKYTGK